MYSWYRTSCDTKHEYALLTQPAGAFTADMIKWSFLPYKSSYISDITPADRNQALPNLGLQNVHNYSKCDFLSTQIYFIYSPCSSTEPYQVLLEHCNVMVKIMSLDGARWVDA